MELIAIHLLTHEVPVLIIAGLSLIYGKRAVFRYVRKHDPLVLELIQAVEHRDCIGGQADLDLALLNLKGEKHDSE